MKTNSPTRGELQFICFLKAGNIDDKIQREWCEIEGNK